MANSYSAVFHHIVFSTKNREPWIAVGFESRLWEYLGGVVRENGCVSLRVGGIETHVHLLVMMSSSVATSDLVKQVKVASTHWIRANFRDLCRFGWQDGYGVFSVSRSSVKDVTDYITNQREHHREKSFEEEYRIFLERHGVEYDESYIF